MRFGIIFGLTANFFFALIVMFRYSDGRTHPFELIITISERTSFRHLTHDIPHGSLALVAYTANSYYRMPKKTGQSSQHTPSNKNLALNITGCCTRYSEVTVCYALLYYVFRSYLYPLTCCSIMYATTGLISEKFYDDPYLESNERCNCITTSATV